MENARISEYGLIGNCRTAALVSRFGSIDWLCFPHFDSPSYFGAILDPRLGGFFAIRPTVPYESRQTYLRNTNVLETVFSTGGGRVRILDCFTVTTEEEKKRDFWPDNEVLRIVEGLEGQVPVGVHFAPKPHFRQRHHKMKAMGKLGFGSLDHEHLLLLGTDLSDELAITESGYGEEVRGEILVRADERHVFSLIYSEEAPDVIPPRGPQAMDRLAKSVRYWRDWVGRGQYQGRYQEQVFRSALALKLMTYAPSGAVIAAPTTSLPEWKGGARNWDYRYCWLRDASFTMRALMMLGYHDEARAYVNWMLDTGASHHGRFQILYDIHGRPTTKERDLRILEGYRGSRPVRLGNLASCQFQLDIYGEVIDAVHSYLRQGQRLDKETRDFLLAMGRKVCDCWMQPDEGIWEPRSGRVQHTHSKVLAWVALDRLTRMARRLHWRKAPVDQFQDVMGQIRGAVEEWGFDPGINSYVQAFGSRAMDASLLVLPLVGYCRAWSPRMRGTIERIRRTIACEELVYRYRETEDGLPEGEGAFGVCSFWLIDALSRSGRPSEARRLFERFLSRSNSVGLWPEEIDPATGEFLGNYPQAFTHIGLINSAFTLDQEERCAQAA